MGDLKDIKDMTPNPGLIRQLKTLLKEAESGRLITMVSVCSWEDRTTTNGFMFDNRSCQKLILSEVVLLQADLVAEIGLDSGRSTLSRELYDPV
jgi:hypothetical protein